MLRHGIYILGAMHILRKACLANIVAALSLYSSSAFCDPQVTVEVQNNFQIDLTTIANPIPASRDFYKNNQNHKVLLAIIDSGVDYNHPYLVNNMHFDLNPSGEPIGLGWDYLGNDPWPSPYLSRPTPLNSEYQRRLMELILRNPALEPYILPQRQFTDEFETSSFHGTHVAGLISFGKPEFGLVPYRVVPFNDMGKSQLDYVKEFVDKLGNAIEAAAKSGVKIVNLSIGINTRKLLNSDSIQAKIVEAQLIKLSRNLQRIFAKHPDILFVAAAGNDGELIIKDKPLFLPCGIKAENLLCVSTINTEGKLTENTNIVMGRSVFVQVNRALSTVPTLMCAKREMQYMENLSQQEEPNYTWLTSKLDSCISQAPLEYMSGTSVAAPLVSRLAATISMERPDFNGKQLIDEILSRARSILVGETFTASVIIPELPNWPKEKSSLGGLRMRGNDSFSPPPERFLSF